ncbi:ureidoglycolate lyase [Arthrobacter sp. B2a2-09]|uniref:ureidoglycolate lyase n=1 Tax=Arthrobacter sp. B2a2-09 TaxID=2952822 RepID=UPI0022CD6E47|nr:ureidoglycolate lyase [Arthrobacter sp. B2a2-09]
MLATEVRAEDFAPFGRVHAMAPAIQPEDPAARLVVSAGDGWSDAYTANPLISTNGSLGMTLGAGLPFATSQMERHLATEEALFTAGSAVVLAVAPPNEGRYPEAHAVRAFIIKPGTAVVLHQGTWHDACHGLDGEAHYYWMATCGGDGGPTWTDVSGGPVHISVDASNTGAENG